MEQHFVTLLMGSNLGDRRQLLAEASMQIAKRVGAIVKMSGLYESQAWGNFEEEEVPAFLNQALVLATTLKAHEILDLIQRIESALGRQRPSTTSCNSQSQGYHSRPIDIDIIYYDNTIINTPELTIPHPRMHLRQFVLMPLCEVIPDYMHPILHHSTKQLLAQCKDTCGCYSWG